MTASLCSRPQKPPSRSTASRKSTIFPSHYVTSCGPPSCPSARAIRNNLLSPAPSFRQHEFPSTLKPQAGFLNLSTWSQELRAEPFSSWAPRGVVMMTSLVDMFFGCWHKNYSFPITSKNRRTEASRITGTYVVCLDCGREFAYDWQTMKVVGREQVDNDALQEPLHQRAA